MTTTSKDSAAETRGAPDARRSTMKAVAVRPGQPNSIHLRDVPMPSLHDVPGERGVLVRVLRVGVDGTDKEINAAEYGKAPPGDDYLILGHESFGVWKRSRRASRSSCRVIVSSRRFGGRGRARTTPSASRT